MEPMKFSERYHAEKLLKRAKKKTKKKLIADGASPSQATRLVNAALKRIAHKDPEQ